MQILHVIPLAASLDTEVLSYFSAKEVLPGTMVTVPLRSRKINALVVRASPVSDLKADLKRAGYQLRNIHDIHPGEIFSPAFLQAADRMKDFYATTTGTILNLMTSSFVLKDFETHVRIPRNDIIDTTTVGLKRILQRPLHERIDYYKTLVREKMFHEESLHIICATRDHCELIFDHIKKNNEDQSFLFHGGMTKKKYQDASKALKELEKTSIIVSTPGFIDLQQFKKSIVIVEQESSDYYRTVRAPFLDTRLFISEYTYARRIECVWADSLVRPETWHDHLMQRSEIIEPLNRRIFKPGDLTIVSQNIDPGILQSDQERYRALQEDTSFSVFGKETLDYIHKGILQRQKIFVFVPKKSLAPILSCNHCGNIARSPESGHPFSLYIQKKKNSQAKERIFICHMTGETIPAFDTCQFCNHWGLTALGIGTETVSEELQKLYPTTPIEILDSSHCKTKKKIKELSKQFHEAKGPFIIVGTILAIENLNAIDRSAVVSLDSYFARMSYSIHPQVLSLLIRILEKTKEGLYLQSRNISEEALPILRTGIFSDYIDTELEERETFKYPPFSTLIVIKKALEKAKVREHYKIFHKLFIDYNPNILVRPGGKRGWLELSVILQIPQKQWNLDSQDPKLTEIFKSLTRNTSVSINPKDLSS